VVSATGNITGNYFIGNGSQLTGLTASYGNANVVTLLANFGSNTISTTGNISGAIVAADGNTSVQINRAGILGAAAGFSYDYAGNVLYAPGAAFSGHGDGTNGLAVGYPAYTTLGSAVMAQFTGNVADYSQVNFQNISNAATASGDYIITADNGNDTTHFLDLGMTSSTWDGTQENSLGNAIGPNSGYLYVQDGNLALGTKSGNTAYVWTFDTTGNIVLPGTMTIAGPAQTINSLDTLTLSSGGQFNICTIAAGGTGYNSGSTIPAATTGGTGTGMLVNFGYGLSGQLVSVAVFDPGSGYTDGDVIGVNGGTGTFTLTRYNPLGNVTNSSFVQSRWNFRSDGVTEFPSNNILVPINEDFNITLQDEDNDGWGLYQVVTDGTGNTLAQTNLQRDEFRIQTDYQGNNYQWSFDDSGRLNLPGNINGVYAGNTSIYAYDDGNSGSVELKTISYQNDTLGSNIRVTQSNAYISTANAAHTWTFDNTGNLVLPKGGIVYETLIPGGTLTGNTIALKPQGGISNDQQLLVYPTETGVDANHLHLTSGNLYNTELFLGNDDLYVKLANTGNIIINSNNGNGNTAQWNFSTNGTIFTTDALTIDVPNGVPNNVTAITGSSGSWEANPSSDLATTGGTGTGLTVNVGNEGGYASSIAIATPGDGYSNGDVITVTSGSSNATFTISVDNNQWTFGTNGNLNVPQGGYIGAAGVKGDGTMLTGGKGNIASLTSFYANANALNYSSCVTVNADGTLNITTYGDGTGQLGQWVFDSANLSVPGNTVIFTPIATGGAGGNSITIQAGSSDSFSTNPGGNLNLIGGYGSFGDGGGPPGGDVNITSGGSYDSHPGNVNIQTGSNTWTFDYTGDLTLPTISLGESTDEQTVIQSQRKLIPPFRWSAEITGSTPTVVYTATNVQTTSMKVTVQIQHHSLGMEFFEVFATVTSPDTYYTVSNRLAPPTIDASTVVVEANGSNIMEITVTINSGADTCWVTYDAVEFGIPVD
jgi:hypothetical protein